jgi:hypothetical protein
VSEGVKLVLFIPFFRNQRHGIVWHQHIRRRSYATSHFAD